MKRVATPTVLILLAASAALAQYKLASAGAPPSELSPAIQEALQKDGAKVLSPAGSVHCEVWFRTAAPTGTKSTEQGVSLAEIPHGALLGAIRFAAQGQDRRGQPIKPGVYTLRYSLFPPDGNHQGVAAQRDFLLMAPAAADTDLNATPSYKEVVAMSAKAAGTSHPAVLSLWKDEAGTAPGLMLEGEADWVLYTKIGEIPVGVILAGVFQG
jgi:hypothetical protein